jgi:hypothetical protein
VCGCVVLRLRAAAVGKNLSCTVKLENLSATGVCAIDRVRRSLFPSE